MKIKLRKDSKITLDNTKSNQEFLSLSGKNLKKKAIDLIKDIFDNYDKKDKYTNDEKMRIISLLNDMNNLNLELDKYDEKESFWNWFFKKK